MAKGKPGKHVPTTNDCGDCHSTNAWEPANVNHNNITGACSGCHNGSSAKGKHAKHIPTTADCTLCHTTTAWRPSTFKHSSVSNPCKTCHDGYYEEGKPTDHIVTNAECDVCHYTTSWTNIHFDHTGVSGTCASCHNGTNATGKSSGHMVTERSCDECHTSAGQDWGVVRYSHAGATYPGNHNSKVTCFKCHTAKTETATWTATQYKPDCAGCHAADFKSGPHKKYESPTTVTYTVAELKDCTGACHIYTDSTLTTIKTTRNSHHVVSKGGW
jgi:hypothetical protein